MGDDRKKYDFLVGPPKGGSGKGAPMSLVPSVMPARLDFGEDLADYQDKLGNNINVERDNLQRKRADLQSEWDKAANATVGGVGSGLLTAVEDLSYMLDIDNNLKNMAGLEHVESNWLADMMKEGKEAIDKAMPIYTKDPNATWDWGDSGQYWKALKGVLDSSVGFAIPGMAATKVVGSVQRLARMSKYLGFLQKSQATQQLVNSLASGYITNYAEGKMMGIELYDNVIEEGKNQLYEEVYNEIKSKYSGSETQLLPERLSNPEGNENAIRQEAQKEFERRLPQKLKELEKNAGDQADKFMLRNKAFMLTDAFGLHGLYKGKGFIKGIMDDPSLKGAFKNFTKLNGGNLFLQGAKESSEEIAQNVLQMEGQYQAKKDSGFTSKSPEDLHQRIWEFATSDQALLEGSMGFFGGGPQRIFTKALTGGYSKKGRENERKQYEQQQWMMNDEEKTDKDGRFNNAWFIKNRLSEEAERISLRNEAINSGKDNMDEILKKNSFYRIAAENFSRGTTEHLERSLQDVASMSKEEAQNKGFDPNYAENANALLRELKQLESSYMKQTKYENAESVFLNRQTRKLAQDDKDYITSELEKAKQAQEQGDVEADADVEYFTNLESQINDHIAKLDEKFESLTSPEVQVSLRKAKRKITQASKKAHKEAQAAKKKEEAAAKKRENEAKIKAEREAKEKAAAASTAPANTQPPASNDELPPPPPDVMIGENGPEPYTPPQEGSNGNIFGDAPGGETETAANPPKNSGSLSGLRGGMTRNEANETVPPDADTSSEESAESHSSPGGESATVTGESYNSSPDVTGETKNTTSAQSTGNKGGKSGAKNGTGKQLEIEFTAEEKEVAKQEQREERQSEEIKDDPYTESTDKKVGAALIQANDALLGVTPSIDKNKKVDALIVKTGSNKFAYLSRKYQDKFSKRTDAENSLNKEGLPGSISLLDLKRMIPGTKIKLVATDDDNIPVYFSGKKFTWGELKKHIRTTVAQEQQENVIADFMPIQIQDENGEAVAFIHQADWINSKNIHGDVVEDLANIRRIRRAVVKEGTVETTVVEKKPGYLFKYAGGETTSVGEAFPDQNLSYFIYRGSGVQNILGNVPENLINKKELEPGLTYAVLPVYYSKEKGIEYLAVPIRNVKLNGEFGAQVAATVRKATEIWLADGELTQDQQEFVDFVFKTTRLNIKNNEGFEKYISTFLQSTNIQGHSALKVGVKDTQHTGFLNQPENKGKSTTMHMSIQSGHLEFARGNGHAHIFVNKGISKDNQQKFLALLEKRVMEMYSNVNRDAMDSGKGTVILDSTGKPVTMTLREYIGKAMSSNVYSVNIAKEGQPPHYVYTVQPVIRFDDSFANQGKPKEEPPKINTSYKKDFNNAVAESKKRFIEGMTNERGNLEYGMAIIPEVLIYLDKLGLTQEQEEKMAEFLNKFFERTSQEYFDLHERLSTFIGEDPELFETEAAEVAKKLNDLYDGLMDKIGQSISKLPSVAAEKVQESKESKEKPTDTNPAPKYKNMGDFDGLNYTLSQEELEQEGTMAYAWGNPEAKERLQQSADRVVIRELGAVRQIELVKFYSIDILQKIFKAEMEGNDTPVSFRDEMKAHRESLKNSIAAAKENLQMATEANLEEDMQRFSKIVDTLEAIDENWNMIKELTNAKIDQFQGIASDMDEEQEHKDESTEAWEDSKAFTTDQKDKLAPQVRKFLAFTKALDKNGTQKKNFFGQPLYEDFDKVYNILQRITAGRRPTLATLIEVLEEQKETHAFMADIIERLNSAGAQVQNQFVTSMTNHYIQMRFIVLERDDKNNLELKDWSANSYAIATTLVGEWKQNLRNSEGVMLNDSGEHFLTEDYIATVIKEIDALMFKVDDKEEISAHEVQNVLEMVGITISDRTARDIVKDKFRIGKVYQLKHHFGKFGLFGVIRNDLNHRGVLSLEAKSFMSETAIKRLSMHDAAYTTHGLSNSNRAGSKTVYSYGLNKYMVNRFRELREHIYSEDKDGNKAAVSPKLTELTQLGFNSESIWLKQLCKLTDDGKFQKAKNGMVIIDLESPLFQNFDYWYVSLEAIKKRGTPDSDDGELYKLSELDNEVFRIGALRAPRQDASGGKNKVIGLTYPTTSDKTTVMGVYALETKIGWNMDGTFDDSLLDTLYDALVAPEIERIKSIQKALKAGKELNNKEMTRGGTKFLMLPQLNNVANTVI